MEIWVGKKKRQGGPCKELDSLVLFHQSVISNRPRSAALFYKNQTIIPFLWDSSSQPGEIWQCLEIILVVTNGNRGVLVTSFWWVKAGNATKHPTINRTGHNNWALSGPNNAEIEKHCSKAIWEWFFFLTYTSFQKSFSEILPLDAKEVILQVHFSLILTVNKTFLGNMAWKLRRVTTIYIICHGNTLPLDIIEDNF